MTRAALLGLGLLVALPACDRPNGSFSRNPNDAGAVLSVPYPVADGERIEGAGRKALSEARFVFVSLGRDPEDRDHFLPERLRADGPLLVAHHRMPHGEDLPAHETLKRLAFGRVAPVAGEAREVDAQEVEALGLQPPASEVWLVGPRGTCRASVAAPVAGLDPLGDAMIVGYRLVGCRGRDWAQVGIVADAIPVDFRWVPATMTVDELHEHPHAWEGPLVGQAEIPAWTSATPPRVDLVRQREIEGTEPQVVQLWLATLAREPVEPGEAWCEVPVSWTRTDGLYNGRWIDPVPFVDDAVGPFLIGAFLNGAQVDAMIYDDRLDGLVVVPPGPLDDIGDPEAWRQVFVTTGVHDPVELQAWGAEPARGPLPIGSSCEEPPEPAMVVEEPDRSEAAEPTEPTEPADADAGDEAVEDEP